MPSAIHDDTRIVRGKEWKGTIAYDKSKDSNKVKALLRLLYGTSYAGAKDNANIDGKWGANTQRRFNNAGLTMSDDWNSYTDRSGNTYTWDGNSYVAALKQSKPEDQLWYLLSDSRLREAQNWINRQEELGKNANIVDWFAMNEANSHSLENAILAGTLEANFVRDLMLSTAGSEALGALSKTAGPLLGKALEGAGTIIGKGMSKANNAIEEGIYQASRLATEPRKVMQLVGNAARGAARSALQSARLAQLSASRLVSKGTSAVLNAGQRASQNITKGWRNVMDKTAEAVTPRAPLYSMAPAAEAQPAEEFVSPYANFSAGTRPAMNGTKPTYYTGEIKPEVFQWQMYKNGGTLYKFQLGGNVNKKQKIEAFKQWGASKTQMDPEVFWELFQKLKESEKAKLLLQYEAEALKGTMARLGAKLDYIKSLKNECPEGQELIYFKKGGRFCKTCVSKNQEGGTTSNPIIDFKQARMEKCGGKAKKKENGGSVKLAGNTLAPKAKCGAKAKKNC